MFKNNAEEVNRIITIILATCSLGIAILLILDGVGWMDFEPRLRYSVYFGFFVCLSPMIIRLCRVPASVLKYYSLIIVALFIGLMGTFTGIGIYISYVLVPIVSCLYFDKKLTIISSIISYLSMAFGVWFNTMDRWEIQYLGWSHIHAFTLYMIGFSIEYLIIMPFAFQIVRRAYKFMKEQHDALNKIKTEEHKYRMLSVGLKDIVFEYDPTEHVYHANKSIYASADSTEPVDIYDFDDKEKCGLDPKVFEKAKELLSQLKQNDTVSAELDASYENAGKHIQLWYALEARILLDEELDNYHIVGKMQNITKSKLMEKKNAQYRLNDFYMDMDDSGRVTMTKKLLSEGLMMSDEDYTRMAESHQILAGLTDKVKTAQDVSKALDEALEAIGRYIGVDRIVVLVGDATGKLSIVRQWMIHTGMDFELDERYRTKNNVEIATKLFDKNGYLEYNPSHDIFFSQFGAVPEELKDTMSEDSFSGNQIWIPTLHEGNYDGAIVFDKYDLTPYTYVEKFFMAEASNVISAYMFQLDVVNKNQEKTKYVTEVSHRMRTPMNAILGMSEVALRMDMPDEVRKCLETINSSTEGLLGVIDEVLESSQITAGRLNIINYDSSKLVISDGAESNRENDVVTKNASVLMADDNEINLQVAMALLEPLEMNIEVAHNGTESLELSRSKKYDLILMDRFMPDMVGEDVTKEIRWDKNNPNINTPIVALTADAIPGVKEQLIAAGMNDFISKPIIYKQACEIIKKWIGVSKSLGE